MTNKARIVPSPARRVLRGGKPFILLAESEYERLVRKADELEPPPLPPTDEDANYPALETLAALQARDILAAHRKLGLSQAELARRAGIAPETLNRIERGRHAPSVPTMAKLDRALADPIQR